KLTDNNMYIRTYERGVEEETLACGTGATASAIIAQLFQHKKGPTTVEMKGGIVHIHFQVKDTMISNITLTGKVITAFHVTTTICRVICIDTQIKSLPFSNHFTLLYYYRLYHRTSFWRKSTCY